MTANALPRRLAAESLGTALLVAAVVGSGIQAERLFPDSPGSALMANVLATVGALIVLIATLGPLSGAHFNPVVSAADVWFGGLARRDLLPYIASQLVGAAAGAILANLMFDLTAVSISTTARDVDGLPLSEVVATFGLLLVVFGLIRVGRASWIAAAVGVYIGAACWFTASTSFANPAVTIGRTLSDTFAGIAPADAPSFIAAQVIGGFIAVATVALLWPTARRRPR